MTRRATKFAEAVAIAVALSIFAAAADYGSVRNGTFDEPQARKATDQAVIDAKRAGTLPHTSAARSRAVPTWRWFGPAAWDSRPCWEAA